MVKSRPIKPHGLEFHQRWPNSRDEKPLILLNPLTSLAEFLYVKWSLIFCLLSFYVHGFMASQLKILSVFQISLSSWFIEFYRAKLVLSAYAESISEYQLPNKQLTIMACAWNWCSIHAKTIQPWEGCNLEKDAFILITCKNIYSYD